MEKFAFSDGEKIGYFDGEKSVLRESEYILRTREYAETRMRRDEWKYTGEGARFRGDYDRRQSGRRTVTACINGVQLSEGKIVYAFSTDGASGVYRKNPADEKEREEHILSSSEEEILSVQGGGSRYAVTVRSDSVTSEIGILDCETSELKTLTDGDSRDANPFFSAEKGRILFDSAGVGRTADGSFSGKYAPAAICSIDLETLEIRELRREETHSLVKPKEGADGALYCIRRPNRERRGGNVFLEMLLIPFRIFQAIVLFVQAFVVLFTGKSLTSGGDNPTKGREQNSGKIYVDGCLIEAEREYKRNKKFKDRERGFIPMSWELIRFDGEKKEVLKRGVCDYALCADGGLYCTNGRHIFYLRDDEQKKVADCERCLSVSTEGSVCTGDPFSL